MATGGSSLTEHLSDHLLCSICSAVFTEPVSLHCQHTFCRECLTESLNAGHQQCPVCRVPIRKTNFQVNRILRDIAQELTRCQEEGGGSEIQGVRGEVSEVCLEHNQPLKLWCKKDKQLLCLVCRDSREHRGHRFKPLDEAREDLQVDVGSALKMLRGDMAKVERLVLRQDKVVTTLRAKVDTHKRYITQRFNELFVLLKEMEETELKKVDEKSDLDGAGGMETNLRSMRDLLERGKTREKTLQAALENKDAVEFLRWWDQESGCTITLRGDNLASPSRSFPRLCLKKSRLQFRYPDSLKACFMPSIEKILARSITRLPITLWEPPLFGNMYDKICLFGLHCVFKIINYTSAVCTYVSP
ncbi:hypothetical protein UPYG_G00128550 [Umbra pygmaea]|uniref:Uncharacterized protein n=1 Tax=Umbra pygmaea TaxID=75934 RepID=A0ABD0XRL7_UMBPY